MVKLNVVLILCLAVCSANLVAQCKSWENYPDGIQKAKEQHMFYREFFNSKKYTEAFPIWEKLFVHVQAPKDAPRRHLKDGIKMYQEFMKKTEDVAKQQGHLQQMVQLYDQLATCTGEKSTDRAFQAYYMYRFKADLSSIVSVAQKAIELGKHNTHETVFVPYAASAIRLFKNKEATISKTRLLEIYEELKTIVIHHRTNKSKKLDAYETKWAKVQALFQEVDSKFKIFDCNHHIQKYRLKYKDYYNNTKQLDAYISVLAQKCGNDNSYVQELVERKAVLKDSLTHEQEKNCLQNCPPYEQAQLLERLERIPEAMEAYKKALLQAESDSLPKSEIAYKLAYYYYLTAPNYPTALKYCKQAIKLSPQWGDPYILLGLIYAASAKDCGTDDWDSRVVYWPAVDTWEKAKAVDLSTTKRANDYILKYSKHFPTVSQGFQRGLKEGDDYTINCWIKVKTTVRLRKSH
ncbi:MAG: hypothetical protein GY810_30440 [Aureispira sp.]|nr:hypothetical protein [Aureispira sp.]